MANPLQAGSTPPPAPIQNPPQQNALQQGGPTQGAPQAAPAPPTHEQTVSALRHFHAVIGEIQSILKDPATGKSDQKSKIIDGTTKLVSERMLSPAQAVMQLSQVPTDPLQQRKWLQTMLAQTAQSANVILDHHAMGSPGTLDSSVEHARSTIPSKDDHMNHMTALGANYSGGK